MKNLKLKALVWSFSVAFLPVAAQGQAISPGSVQKSIEQIQKPVPVQKPAAEEANVDGLVSIDKLAGVEVRGGYLEGPIKAYWASRIGKAVEVEEVADFKVWASELTRQHGFLGYAQTSTEPASNGAETLVVSLVIPKIKSVKVFVADEELAKRYEALLVSRFADVFKPGTPVDPQALDQRLEVASYDLPVSLEVLIRAAGAELVDLTVNVEAVRVQTGQRLSGLLQGNNYGLKQYGRTQLMGAFGFSGFTPNATMNVSAQLSEGVRYARGEYEAPVEVLKGRVKGWLNESRSHTILGGATASKANSSEYGIGLTHLWGNYGAHLIKSVVEVADRQTSSRLALNGQETSRIKDTQLKMRLSLDNERVTRESDTMEMQLSIGHLRDISGDTTPPGQYTKLEFSGKRQRTLTLDGNLQGLIKVRGQVASHNLDSYNRLALGGVSGVRAYTAADGVGDYGAQATLELNQKLGGGKSMGIFYDAGWIKPNKSPVSGVFNDGYGLQAVGMQWSGNFERWYYNVTLAQGIKGYKKAQVGEATESKANAGRLSASMSYLF